MSELQDFLKTVKPMDDRILVEPLEDSATETASGIILPDSMSKEKPQKGKVVAVGPGKMLESGQRQQMTISVGQTVLYTRYGPTEVKVGGHEVTFINESDVLAVIA
jgi:chaperonin GroES